MISKTQRLFLPNNPRITAGSDRVYARDLRNQWARGARGVWGDGKFPQEQGGLGGIVPPGQHSLS